MRARAPFHTTRPLRLLAGVIICCAVAACGDATGVRFGSVHLLVVQGGQTGQRLVEYTAPPLIERRSMPLGTRGGTLDVLRRDGTDGGFYALRFDSTRKWELVRYDADWHVAATRSAAELVDTLSMDAGATLAFTPDHRHLVLFVNPVWNGSTVVVLDPVTLAVENRTDQRLAYFVSPFLSAATGSEILFTGPDYVCPSPVVWFDVATARTADSTGMPCHWEFQGAATHRRIYRLGGPASTVQLYDISSGTVLAATDSVKRLNSWYPVATRDRLIYFEPRDILVLDAATLTRVGRIVTWDSTRAPRFVMGGHFDDPTGLIVATTAPATAGCVACIPTSDGIMIIDPTKLRVVMDAVVGDPLDPVW